MTNALVLSGGGAKGSFELGAVQYLYKYNFRPDIVCSTSVGSMNALKLAEGERSSTEGFQGLQQLWLGLNNSDDMFVKAQWYQNTPDWLSSAIDGSYDPSLLDIAALIFVPFLAASKLQDISDFMTNLRNNKSLYTLEPLRQLAIRSVNLSDVATSGIKLRMAAVSLESGVVRYVTEKGRLLTDPTAPSDDPNSPQVDILSAMLASAAIPLAFEPQNLAGEWYVDGGAKAIVPLQAAISMGATEIYEIVAPMKLDRDDSYDQKGNLDIANRAVDILIDTVTDYNISDARGSGALVLPVRATLEVESSRTIDPGLIRINSAYGYMRAFDMLEQFSPSSRASLVDLSDQIGGIRKAIWDQENQIYNDCSNFTVGARSSTGVGPLVTRAQGQQIYQNLVNSISQEFADLRALKNALQGEVICRENVAGSDSLPPEQYETWNLQWEPHQYDITSIPGAAAQPATPWDSVTINPNLSGGDSSGDGQWSITGPPLIIPSAVPQVAPYGLCPKVMFKHSSPTGNYLQSDYGNVGNFEVVVIQGESIRHYFRNNDAPSTPWAYLRELPNPWKGTAPTGTPGGIKPPSGLVGSKAVLATGAALAANIANNLGTATGSFSSTANPSQQLAGHPAHFVPDSVSFFQSDYRSLFPYGNFEAVVHFKADDASFDFLAAYSYGPADNQWHGPFPIIVDGNPISGVTGKPAFIQSNWGGVGNFDMLVPQGSTIKHYARFNDVSWMPWVYLGDLPTPGVGGGATSGGGAGSTSTAIPTPKAAGGTVVNVVRPPPVALQPATYSPTSVSFVQSSIPHQLFPWGKFGAVVRLVSDGATADDYLATYEYDFRTSRWSGPFDILVNGSHISGVGGNPVIIQSDFGVNGNFELLAIQNGDIKHYFRNNDDPSTPWVHARDVIGEAGTVGGTGSGSGSSGGSGGVPGGGGGGKTGGVGIVPKRPESPAAGQLQAGTIGGMRPPQTNIYSPVSVSFFQSNYKSTPSNGNFEALVQMGASDGTDYLTTYYYGAADNRWHALADVMTNGERVTGVTQF